MVKKGEEKKGFIWYSTIIGFTLMCVLFIVSIFVASLVIGLLLLLLMPFTLVVSIIHLFKHKKKAFAIVSLVISALLTIFYTIGLLFPPATA